jgi:seryl-tRNA synthetase
VKDLNEKLCLDILSFEQKMTETELEITQLQKKLEEQQKQGNNKSPKKNPIKEAMEQAKRNVADLKQKEARDQILWFVAKKMRAINIEFKRLYVTEYPQNVTRYYNDEIDRNDVDDIPDAYHMWGSDIVAVFKKLMTTKHNIPPRSDQEWAELGLAVAKLASFCYFRSAQNVSPEDVYWALRDTDVDEHVKPLIVSLVMASS